MLLRSNLVIAWSLFCLGRDLFLIECISIVIAEFQVFISYNLLLDCHGGCHDNSERNFPSLCCAQYVVDDVRKAFVVENIWPGVQANCLYEDRYLMGTALARPQIAKGLVKCAKQEGAQYIAHGATGKVSREPSIVAAVLHWLSKCLTLPSFFILRVFIFCGLSIPYLLLLSYLFSLLVPLSSIPSSAFISAGMYTQ